MTYEEMAQAYRDSAVQDLAIAKEWEPLIAESWPEYEA